MSTIRVRVNVNGESAVETVTADSFLVSKGDRLFVTNGNVMVKVYASGTWLSVERVEENVQA
jgi:hypothetical protein